MKHHYIPQFLLNAWAKESGDGKIEVFRLDIDDIPSSRRAAKYTGYESNLYALSQPVVMGMEQQAIELRFLRHVDDIAARVRQKLETEGLGPLSADERYSWIRFLMSLRLRQPELVAYLKQEAATKFRETLAENPEEYNAAASSTDPPTMEEWAEKHFPGIIENSGLSLFTKIVDNENIGKKIFGMNWLLWDVKKAPNDLLLADNPCIFTSGIDDPNLIVALPVSPTKAFFATNSEKAVDGIKDASSTEIVKRLNESSLNQAQFRIYARDRSQERFIRNRKGNARR